MTHRLSLLHRSRDPCHVLQRLPSVFSPVKKISSKSEKADGIIIQVISLIRKIETILTISQESDRLLDNLEKAIQ